MSTPPRRRRPDPPDKKPEGGGWLPTIAMGLGVVVAGLGIGALVAVLMQRSGGKPPTVPSPVAVVTSTAAPSAPPGRAPVAMVTFVAARTPRPSPSPSPSPSGDDSAEPSVEPSPSPTPTARPTPRLVRTMGAQAVPRAVAAAPPRVTHTATPEPVAAVTPAPLPSRPPETQTSTPAPPVANAVPSPAAAASAATEPPSAYDEHASGVVRRYVDALIRGDEKTAYAALGGSGGTLTEQAFLDPGARIVSLKVTRIDASNASVGCEIVSAKGHFYATYHVTAATSGPYISEHDYIKV